MDRITPVNNNNKDGPSGTPEMFGTLGMTKPPKNYRHAHPTDNPMLSRASVAAEKKQPNP